MANDEFDNSRTDKEMLKRFTALPVSQQPEDPFCLMARLDTAAFMAFVPIRRKMRDGLELNEFQLQAACSIATSALDSIAYIKAVSQ